MDSFNEVINWDEDELAHLFRGMLLPPRCSSEISHALNKKTTTVLVETEMLPFFHQMVDFHSEARKSWFLQLVTPATHPEVFRGNNPHLGRSISMVDALLIGMWSRTISCYLGAKIHVWAKFCDGGFMLWTASCVFFPFQRVEVEWLLLLLWQAKKRWSTIFESWHVFFCGCMHFISVPSDILLRLAVFCFSKMHIFPNLNSAKFMTYKYLKISHGDQSLRIHTRRYNDSKIFNRSQICSDYLCFFFTFAWEFRTFAKQIQVVPLFTVGFAPWRVCLHVFLSGLPLQWIGAAWSFATLAWRLSFRRWTSQHVIGICCVGHGCFWGLR